MVSMSVFMWLACYRVAASAMISSELPRGAVTASIFGFLSSSDALYSGGIGGGSGFTDLAVNSSRNFATKLCTGHEHASPNAQIVFPAMLSATYTSVSGSLSVPPPAMMRSVILRIHCAPSRHGVHWPQLSCA